MAIKKQTQRSLTRKSALPEKTAKKTTMKKAAAKRTTAKSRPGKLKKSPVKKAAAKNKPASLKKALSKQRLKARMVANIGNADTKNKAKDGEYMEKEQLDYFRSLLMQWKEDLMNEVDRTMNHMKTEVTNFADPADRATQEEEFSLELRARDRERKLIRKIDRALKYIDKKVYGYCHFCGAEIGYERLKARPTASMCIDCKTLQEYQEKQINNR